MRDVLSLSQPRTPLIERVNVNEVVCERLGLIARLLGDLVEVEPVLDATVGDVLVDRKSLEHALLSLVAHARQAMLGGGRLRIATGAGVDDGRPTVTLAVTDSGAGMTDDARLRALERSCTARADSGGAGIGLEAVHRFALESGGSVALESVPMKATTVTVSLPRLSAAEPRRRLPIERVDPANGGATVLVADKNRGISHAMQTVLEARGYTVVLASSAERALEVAAAHRPEIALVDTQLMQHDQRTFLHRLRAASGSVRIVFLSVAPSVAPESVTVRFLPKEFSDEELVRAVGDALASPR